MKRLLTAAIGVPLALAAVFLLPGWGFFVLVLALLEWAVVEYMAIGRRLSPQGPLAVLLLAVPLAAVGLSPELFPWAEMARGGEALLLAAAVVSLGAGSVVLFARTPLEDVVGSLGLLSFGIPYFALPIAAICWLQQLDPWVLFLLLAIVWLGDTAAYYLGSRFGRHKMAPVVSPEKSWEGAIAGFVTGILATWIWSHWRLGSVSIELIAVGAATAIFAQVGDLVESMLKRAAGVKDSGALLPGHGGVLDRMDAMLFAAPALLLGLWWLGYSKVLP